MAVAAERQDLLNKIGLGLLFGTLVFTGWAAWSARRAAIATHSAAIAAETSAATANNTLKSMEGTSERQLRAYVGVSKVEVDKLGVGHKTRLRITIKNFGQTPAYAVRRWADMKVADRSETSFPDDDDDGGARTMNPGDSFILSSRHEIDLTQDDMDRLKADTARIFLWGRLTYDDVFGSPHEATFRFEYGGSHTMDLNAFSFCAEGNEAD